MPEKLDPATTFISNHGTMYLYKNKIHIDINGDTFDILVNEDMNEKTLRNVLELATNDILNRHPKLKDNDDIWEKSSGAVSFRYTLMGALRALIPYIIDSKNNSLTKEEQEELLLLESILESNMPSVFNRYKTLMIKQNTKGGNTSCQNHS